MCFSVLDPIPTKGLTSDDVNDLTRTTRELMLKELVELSSKSQGRPMAMPAAEIVNSTGKSSGIDAKTNSH
jgi:lysophosphatidate acyltransferase